MGRPVTAGEVEQAAAGGRRQLFVPVDAVITTVARERAERLGVEIIKGAGSPAAAPVATAPLSVAPAVPATAEWDGGVLGPAEILTAAAAGITTIRLNDRVAIDPAASGLARERGIRLDVYHPPTAAAPMAVAPPAALARPASVAPAPSPAPTPAPAVVASPAAPTSAPPVAPNAGAAPATYRPDSPGVVRTPPDAPIARPFAGPSTAAVEAVGSGTGYGGGPSTAATIAPPVMMPVAPPVAPPLAPPAQASVAVAPPPSAPAAAAPASPRGTVELDPITIDLIENALRNIRSEMDAVLFRTAMSPGIREQHDMFPLVANPDGKMVVGQFGSFIKGFLDNWKGTVEEGDIFLLNDPYSCAGAISHLNDWLILLPIHYDHEIVGWASMFGHLTDVGGAVPSSMPIDARTIHSEGVVIRPFKLYKQGVLDEEALQFILDQVRLPEWNRADLMGIVAACRLAERRVKELCARFGARVYIGVLDALLDRTLVAMKELIARNIAETPQSFEDYVDDDGQGYGPYKLKCTVWREGDKVVFDWTGTDPQSPAAINFYLNVEMLKMFVGVYLIMVFDPQILFNDGYYELIDVRIPEGSLLRPRYPAALSGRTHALGRVFDVFGGALGKNTPEFMNGAGFSTSPHLMYSGYDDNNEWFQLYQIGFGGVPGRPIGDGLDGHSLWPEFTNVPNEYLETYFPLIIERYECVADSGGAGYNRGGCGIDVVYKFLADGEISIHDDRWLTYPWGVLGGKPATRGRKYTIKPDGRRVDLPAKADHVAVERGDEFHYVTWGGGGWGDPLTREPERVRLDVLRGLVTERGAEEDYGVIITGGGDGIDEAATVTLRDRLRAARPALQNFDFGPPLAEILARCKEETGMEPPVPPVFRGARVI